LPDTAGVQLSTNLNTFCIRLEPCCFICFASLGPILEPWPRLGSRCPLAQPETTYRKAIQISTFEGQKAATSFQDAASCGTAHRGTTRPANTVLSHSCACDCRGVWTSVMQSINLVESTLREIWQHMNIQGLKQARGAHIRTC
jgi:hypothetical protein